MSKYSIIKLTNGQDIIGKIVSQDADSNENIVMIESPMTILTTTLDNGASIVFLRSYALLSKTKAVAIEKNHIITMYEPQKVMVDYYTTMIDYNKKFIEDDMIKGMKSAQLVIKDVVETGSISRKDKDPYEKTLDYWESLMKSDKKH
jgi:hypothetical protein